MEQNLPIDIPKYSSCAFFWHATNEFPANDVAFVFVQILASYFEVFFSLSLISSLASLHLLHHQPQYDGRPWTSFVAPFWQSPFEQRFLIEPVNDESYDSSHDDVSGEEVVGRHDDHQIAVA